MELSVTNFIGSLLQEGRGSEPLVLNYVWLLPALPFLAFIINGFFGRRLGRTAGWIASVLVTLSFLMSVLIFIDVLNRPEHSAPFQYTLYTWIPSGDFHVEIAFLVDQLTAIMLLVVTSVGAL